MLSFELVWVTSLSGFRGPLRASWAPPEPQNGALPRTKSLVETKFDLHWPCLSGLGSIWCFSGFWRGHGRFYVSAARFLLRQRFGAIFSGSQALGLRVAPAKRQPQICCGARAVGRSLVTHFAVIGARLGDLPWRLPGTSPGFPGTSNSSNRRAAAHKVSSRNQI